MTTEYVSDSNGSFASVTDAEAESEIWYIEVYRKNLEASEEDRRVTSTTLTIKTATMTLAAAIGVSVIAEDHRVEWYIQRNVE